MKGNRTLIVMGLGVVWSALAFFGIDVPLAEQEAVAVGLVSIAGIVMRVMTTTPVGKAD